MKEAQRRCLWTLGLLLLPGVLGPGKGHAQGKGGLLVRLAGTLFQAPPGEERDAAEKAARKSLETWFRNRGFPLPANPDGIVALPSFPLVLDGVPDLLRVVDLLRFQNRGRRLPFRVDPSLALGQSWARKRSWSPGGSWWFEDLLPETPLPQYHRVRPTPRAILLSRLQAPPSLAAFFSGAFLTLVRPGLRPEVRDRAAIELGALGILDWEGDLAPILRIRPELEDSFLLLRASSFALGGEGASALLPLSEWFRAFEGARGDRAFYLGIALRRAFQLGLLQDRVDPGKEAWARILAGLAPGSLAPRMETLLHSRLPPPVETALVLSLSRQPGPLPGEWTKVALERIFGPSPIPPGNQGNRRMGAWLLLLLMRHPESLRGRSFSSLGPELCGEDPRRGRLLGRNLASLGKKKSLEILEALSRRKTLSGGDLGLLSAFDSFGVPGRGLTLGDLVAAAEAKETTPMGRVLIDLGLGELRESSPPSRDAQVFLRAAFERLLRDHGSPIPKPSGWDQALGKALGKIFNQLPQGPGGRSASQWIAGWVQSEDMHAVGMKAFEVAVKHRTSLFADTLSRLDRGKSGNAAPLRILRTWSRLVLRNPLPAGLSLWSPLDPLLGERELEFDLPLIRR